MLTESLFDRFRLTVAEKRLGVYGVHVYQEGAGALEHRFRADDRTQLWSVSKAYTSLAVGMCVDEGRLSLADPVLGYFPGFEAVAAEGSEAITIIDLLQMRSGKDYVLFEEEDLAVINASDWAELFFRGEITSPPGGKFFYANGCAYMLSRLVEKVSGLVLRDYLRPRLFDPLRVLNPWWNSDPAGHTLGAYGLQLTTSELARLGRLLLQEGVWEDQALVSADYIRAMWADTVPQHGHFPDPESNAGYGYQVWRNTIAGYRADGMYGQYSIVIPDKRAVITTTAHNETNACDIIRAAFADIADRLG
ncbi:MAG: beta-lactamase family protein [Bifidobacteriaceae bacterium]|jgi:CubicO group peptidase (beta-lactamase class C family)|nr:beta-lactamase family protein [Bifidobacteriaceae bacterium]